MLYRALYIVIIFLFSFTVYSQDTIVKKDNSKIIAKIIEVNPTEIKYKQPDNLDGLIYNPRLRIRKKSLNFSIKS